MTTPHIAYPYDYQRVEATIMEFAPQWLAQNFDGVVAIARGGLVPATMAATILDLPLFAVSYVRAQREVCWFTTKQPQAGARLLLVEDIAGRGTTLADCAAFLRQLGCDITIFTLAYDAQSRVIPDYGHEIPPGYSVWFPWERESITPAFAATGNQPDKPLYTYASWAIDLDGVLLPDLPVDAYLQNLIATLSERDQLKPVTTLPRLDLASVTIITGRPESDRDRTQAWLNRYGFCGPLVMRDPTRYTAQETSWHKADAIVTRRHTHFIESDAAQAIDIARRLRVARVFWWNGATAISVIASAENHLGPS